jgi:hypothetical protein
MPGIAGRFGADSDPVAITHHRTAYRSPRSVSTIHRPAASSKVAAVTRVPKRKSLRRLNRSATWFRYRSISGWVDIVSGKVHSCSSSASKLYEYSIVGTSHRHPGYRFQYHVPPTPSPASIPRTRRPRRRKRYIA